MLFWNRIERRRAAMTLAIVMLCLSLTGCLHRTLLTDLSEEEAREAVVALYKGRVRASVSKAHNARGQDDGSWTVEVVGGDRTRVEAWRILQENGLPRHREAGIEEVYRNSQLIPTASEERARFLLALSGELCRSLKTLPGVVDARVHVVAPDYAALRDPNEKPRPSASVLLKYWAGYAEPSQQQIRKLVANGVEGLQEDRISVMISKLEPAPRDNRNDLANSVAPTIGLVVDYAFWGGGILAGILLACALLNYLPSMIRWVRTQLAYVRESLV
jgi:type III secretion protein J